MDNKFYETTSDNILTITVNKELHLFIKLYKDGYSVDFYKHSEFDEPLESDYITNKFIDFRKLTNYITVYSLTTDDTDYNGKSFYELRGSDLYNKEDTMLLDDVSSEDDLVEFILNHESGYVYKIKLDKEIIFNDEEI